MKVLRVLALVAVWCVLTRELTVLNVLLGAALAAVLVRVTSMHGEGAPGEGASDDTGRARSLAAAGRRALTRPLRAVELAGFFLYELVLSNVRIAAIVLRPRLNVTPTILEVPVDAESDEELALLSDLVTLTPGTLSLDVADDGRTLLVHVLSTDDPEEVCRDIREGLGRRVRRLFE